MLVSSSTFICATNSQMGNPNSTSLMVIHIDPLHKGYYIFGIAMTTCLIILYRNIITKFGWKNIDGHIARDQNWGHAHQKKMQKTRRSVFDFESSDKDPKVKASDQLVLSALQDITKTLNKLVDRVEGTEKDLKYVKRKLRDSPSSSSDSSVSKRSHLNAPRIVCVSIYTPVTMYNVLLYV